MFISIVDTRAFVGDDSISSRKFAKNPRADMESAPTQCVKSRKAQVGFYLVAVV